MHASQLHETFAAALRLLRSRFIAAVAMLLALGVLQPQQAQTLRVLHTFTGGSDGGTPYAPVTLDRGGNVYGTYMARGAGHGGVYELERHGSDWVFKSLYQFQGGDDGYAPHAPVVFGPDGALYGTTYYGGNTCFSYWCGVVYSLRPPARFCSRVNCPWTNHTVYLFGGSQLHDGFTPSYGPLAFDSAGNMYGTTFHGGQTGNGIVYQLVRTQGGWTENILDNFQGLGTPGQPESGVTLGPDGNLYGTSPAGYSFGAVYAVLRNGGQWTQQTIYEFQGGTDGATPRGGLIFDAAGNAYGSTAGNITQPGTVFKLTPQGDGTWQETVLHTFNVGSIGPTANLAMDAAGNLYGTTLGLGGLGGDRFGMIFKLSLVNGSWVFTDLYDFQNGNDGMYPTGATVDSAGNIFGTSVTGGGDDWGNVWEFTP